MRMSIKLFATLAVIVLIPVVAVAASNAMATPAEASPLAHTEGEVSDQLWFAKYDGIDGESTGGGNPNDDGSQASESHDKWIDVLSIDWGSNKPGGGATGQSRRRGSVIVEDLTITMAYEKASVKLLEKLNMGEVIPKLEIEQTSTYGGARATYLKYELKNVQITSFNVSGAAADGGPPTVTITNNFEEYKVTYTEYDAAGGKGGNVETTWKVEKGAK